MPVKTQNSSDLTQHTAVVYQLVEELLQAGVKSQMIGGKSREKFDSSSLKYEQVRYSLDDAIQTARAGDTDSIPFYLSHDALLRAKDSVPSRPSAESLRQANMLVFIHTVEEILDRGGNPNGEAALHRNGFSGDRQELVGKLRDAMKEFNATAKTLGAAELPRVTANEAAAHTAAARQERESEISRVALKDAGLSTGKLVVAFSNAGVKKVGEKAGDDHIIYVVAEQGRIKLQNRNKTANSPADAVTGDSGKSTNKPMDTVILGKLDADQAMAAGENLRVTVESGKVKIDSINDATMEFMKSQMPRQVQVKTAEPRPDVIATLSLPRANEQRRAG